MPADQSILRFHTLSHDDQIAQTRDLRGTHVVVVTHAARRPAGMPDTYEGTLVTVARPASRGRPMLIITTPYHADPVAITTYWITEIHPAEVLDRG